MKVATQSNVATPAAVGDVAGRYKWWVVFMLWWVCFFNYSDRQAIFSVFPRLETEFGYNKAQLGRIASAFMWVYAFGAPIAGFAADRLKRKHLILGGCVFWSGVTMLTSGCARLWQFVTVRGLEGMGETFYFPASTSLISDYHSPRTRSRALALHNSGVYVGTIAGGWLGAWFCERWGWQSSFLFFGAAGILVSAILCVSLREPLRGQSEAVGASEPGPAPSWSEVSEALLRNRTAVLLLAAFAGANFVATIFLTWTPTFLVEKFGFRLTAAGLSGSVFIHLASALSIPLGGWLADAWARRHGGARMLVQAIGLLCGSIFVFLVGTTRKVELLLLVMGLYGTCKGLYDSNIFAAIFDVVEPYQRGTAAGIMNTVGWAGGALGPLAVGWVSQYGRHPTQMENMSEAIAACSVIYVAGGILLLAAASRAAREGRLKPVVRTDQP